MYQSTLIFLLAALEYAKAIDVIGTLSCGDVVEEVDFTDSSGDYYLLDVSLADDFIVNTCGTYNLEYLSSVLYLYTYSGSNAYVSSIDSDDLTQIDYSSYFSTYYSTGSDDTDCRYWDGYITVDEETKTQDYYAAQVAVSWGSYTRPYTLKLVCPDIQQMVGSLSCGEEAEGTLWESDEEVWFLDTGGSDFTVSTCGSESEYGVNTKLTMYGYEGALATTATYSNIEDWTAIPAGVNDDDYYDYCIGDSVEDHLTDDSYLVEDDAEYDVYVVIVQDASGTSVGQHYNLQLNCGSSSSADALTSGSSTGVIVAAIIVPLVILVFAVWMYRKKQDEPIEQNNMQMQQQMYAGGMMYGQQMGATGV